MSDINEIFDSIIDGLLKLLEIYYDDDINYNFINNYLYDFLYFVNGDKYEI